jgi:predicted HTH domain antitoxin
VLETPESLLRFIITVSAELLEAAGVSPADASRESPKRLALELSHENKVSLGRAAELCDMPIEAFMVFAGRHEAPMHYSVSDLEEDRLTLERLSA